MSYAVLADAMHGMLTNLESILVIVLRTFLVYLFVVVGVRLAGKREVGQMTPIDLVLILLIANAVQNAMVGPDNSLVGGLVSATVLLSVNRLVSRLAARSKKLSALLRGHARLLVNRGVVVNKTCTEEGISREDLMQALREHDVHSLEDVRMAVLEVDGTISILKYDEVSPEGHKPHHRIRFRNAT